MKVVLQQKHLKYVRMGLGVLVLALMLVYFLNRNFQHGALHALTTLQVVPAIMIATTALAGALVVLLVLTLVLGRIYCSVLCPLGLLQDAIARLPKWIRGKKYRYHYSKPNHVLRYALLGCMVLAWVLGFNAVVSLLDPYSAFGRIAANLMRPLVVWINNIVAGIAHLFGSYGVYKMSLDTVTLWVAIVSGVSLLLIGVMAALRGRLYCNTVCPVGTGLGLLSRLSVYKVSMDTQTCNSCGVCATKCKAQCIDTKQKQVDVSRCVACYNCLGTCSKGAINLTWSYKRSAKASEPATEHIDTQRRKTMALGLLALAAIPLKAAAQKAEPVRTSGTGDAGQGGCPVMPPGAGTLQHFTSHCTACHLCVSKCPAQVIKPSFLEYGWAATMQPLMDYRIGFCSYDCTVCSDVCPTHALQAMTITDKRKLQIGKAVFTREKCVVYTNGTDCGACSEHCPTQAVHMVPYKDGLRIPEVNQDICVGCGGCEYICPVTPRTAIHVEGSRQQVQLHMAKEEKAAEVTVDDFGF